MAKKKSGRRTSAFPRQYCGYVAILPVANSNRFSSDYRALSRLQAAHPSRR
jgi:hypothetical protein